MRYTWRILFTSFAVAIVADRAPAQELAPRESQVYVSAPGAVSLATQDPLTNNADSAPSPPSSSTSLTEADIEALVDQRIALREAEAKAAIAPTATSNQADLSMSAKWNKGLELTDKNKDFRIHIGGRTQFDTSWLSAEDNVQNNINIPYSDGVDFRRARLRIDGTMYKYVEYAVEYDFVNSFRARNQPTSATAPNFIENTTVALTDMWWQVRDVPFFGVVRVGQQKEAIGFEHLVSSRFLPFMERSYNQDTFYGGTFNGFSPGISASRTYGDDDTGTINYGLYKPVNNVFGYNTGDGDYSFVARVTKLLAYCSDDSEVLHVGLSGKQATAVGQAGIPGRVQTFRTREAIRAGLSQDWSVPAGINLFGDDLQQVNAELAGIFGRWTLQSEYLVSSLQDARLNLNDPTSNNAVYHGGYVQVLRFLTDDHDHYDKERGTFDRVTPRRNFAVSKSPCGSSLTGGAWQIGARYNYLDLNDIGLNGGVLHNQTYGLNWFMNPNMKAQFNYFNTYRNVSATTSFADGSGWGHGFGGRIACDF